MKFFILSISAATALMAGNILSTASSANSFLSNGVSTLGLGYSRGKGNTNNITTFYEYSVLVGAGLRFEYSRNFNKISEATSADINKYGLFAIYNIYIPTSDFSITPKIGLVKTDSSFTIVDTYKKLSNKKTTFTYGLELNYNFNDSASVFVGYTDYGKNIKKLNDVNLKNLDGKNVSAGVKINL